MSCPEFLACQFGLASGEELKVTNTGGYLFGDAYRLSLAT